MESSSNPATVVSVDREILQQLVVKLLQRKGMFAAEAEIVAERMIEADLCQNSAAGVGSLPEYLDAMDLGDIDPRARLISLSDTPAAAMVDGSTGIGHVATTKAMLMAVEKARGSGVGMVVIRNSRPAGDLGGVARLAAVQGLIGLAATSYDAAVESADEPTVAWSYPNPDGGLPIVQREPGGRIGPPLSLLLQALSAGLASADPPPRKRKAVRAANQVEYTMVAINPETFAARDAWLNKWQSLWSTTALPSQDGSLVPLPEQTARTLAELAAKVKFAVPW